MSLVNVITVDLSANTATLTSTSGATAVETIEFVQSTGNITFSSRASIGLNLTDFNNLLSQTVLLQNAIITNFNPGNIFITPFNSFVSNEHYISFTNSWTLVCNESSDPTIVSDYADKGAMLITLASRPASITFPFSEWVMLLQSQKHYQTSVNNFFNS
jgi:hypothetical protein